MASLYSDQIDHYFKASPAMRTRRKICQKEENNIETQTLLHKRPPRGLYCGHLLKKGEDFLLDRAPIRAFSCLSLKGPS